MRLADLRPVHRIIVSRLENRHLRVGVRSESSPLINLALVNGFGAGARLARASDRLAHFTMMPRLH